MRILIVPDSFKESASSIEVSSALSQGIYEAWPEAHCQSIPVADGGEGSLEALHYCLGGDMISVDTSDPLGRDIQASYLLVDDQAFIELAQASGLHLLDKVERDPLHASTYGTGVLIRHAIDAGINKVVLCIGGSATNDAGVGIAHALGYRFLNKKGQTFLPTGGTLHEIVDTEEWDRPPGFQMDVLCDVNNPFTGDLGATYIYGPQKGASEVMLKFLEKGMEHVRNLLLRKHQIDLNEIKGAGAAGGVGGGMVAFFDAKLVSGIDYLIHRLAVKNAMEVADLIITGEGKIDSQTLQGKLISGLVRIADEVQKPVIGICGSLELTNEEMKTLGLKAAFSIQRRCNTWEFARRNAITDIRSMGYQIGGLAKSLANEE